MDDDSLTDLFGSGLRAAHAMEATLVDSLGEVAEGATNDELAGHFADHREETRTHVERVGRVLDALGLEPAERRSPAVEGLIEERRVAEERLDDAALRNVCYLVSGMTVERVELSTYEGLLVVAGWLDVDDEVTGLLEANRSDEEDAFHGLRSLLQTSEVETLARGAVT